MNENSPNEEASISDRIGLSLEDVRTLLVKTHGTPVSNDDPLLMMVTLTNAFLNEYEKMLHRHHAALISYLGDAGAQHLEAAQRAVEAITTGFKASSIGVIQEHFLRHHKAMASFQSNMVWLAAIVAISAAVNVAVFVYRAVM